jgi:hypothetical protein
MQAVAVQIFTVALTSTICSVYLSLHNIVTLADLQDLLCQLPVPLLLLGNNTWHHIWGSVDEDKGDRDTDTEISPCGAEHE